MVSFRPDRGVGLDIFFNRFLNLEFSFLERIDAKLTYSCPKGRTSRDTLIDVSSSTPSLTRCDFETVTYDMSGTVHCITRNSEIIPAR